MNRHSDDHPDALADGAVLFDRALPLEERARLLARWRARTSGAAGAARIDGMLLDRCDRQGAALDELAESFGELRRVADKLTSAPVQEGVFIEACQLPDGRALARVHTGARVLLVECRDDALLPAMRAGERVLLASEGNVILARHDTRAHGEGDCVTVQHWLDGHRLLVHLHEQPLVLRAAAWLTQDQVRSGDIVRTDRSSGFALERIEPATSQRCQPRQDSTRLPVEAMAGYDEVRDLLLRRVGYAVAHPEIAALHGLDRQRPWVLLGGPPGVGKTTLARVLAAELGRTTGQEARVFVVNGAELTSPYVGETERQVRALLDEVRDQAGWSIVFLDEVDAIARMRSSGNHNVHADRFLATWLSELEGYDGKLPAIVIAATNRLDLLDSAFRSRFATELELPRPGMDAARSILACHLGDDLPYCAQSGGSGEMRSRLIEAALARLYLPNAPGAELCTLRLRDGKARAVHARELVSGRLLEQTCLEARERAFHRHVEGDPSGLTLADMDAAVSAALERLRTTLTPVNAHAYLTGLPLDAAVVAVEQAPAAPAVHAFLREVA